MQQSTWTRNPQYALEVFDEPADVFIELGQCDPRYHLPKSLGEPTLSKEAKQFVQSPQMPKYEHSIGILVVQHNFGSADSTEENSSSGIVRVRQFDRENVRACTFPFVNDRVVTLSFVANPGKYIIIPMHLKPQIMGEYSIRVLSESEFDLFGEGDATWEDPPSDVEDDGEEGEEEEEEDFGGPMPGDDGMGPLAARKYFEEKKKELGGSLVEDKEQDEEEIQQSAHYKIVQWNHRTIRELYRTIQVLKAKREDLGAQVKEQLQRKGLD